MNLTVNQLRAILKALTEASGGSLADDTQFQIMRIDNVLQIGFCEEDFVEGTAIIIPEVAY